MEISCEWESGIENPEHNTFIQKKPSVPLDNFFNEYFFDPPPVNSDNFLCDLVNVITIILDFHFIIMYICSSLYNCYMGYENPRFLGYWLFQLVHSRLAHGFMGCLLGFYANLQYDVLEGFEKVKIT